MRRTQGALFSAIMIAAAMLTGCGSSERSVSVREERIDNEHRGVSYKGDRVAFSDESSPKQLNADLLGLHMQQLTVDAAADRNEAVRRTRLPDDAVRVNGKDEVYLASRRAAAQPQNDEWAITPANAQDQQFQAPPPQSKYAGVYARNAASRDTFGTWAANEHDRLDVQYHENEVRTQGIHNWLGVAEHGTDFGFSIADRSRAQPSFFVNRSYSGPGGYWQADRVSGYVRRR